MMAALLTPTVRAMIAFYTTFLGLSAVVQILAVLTSQILFIYMGRLEHLALLFSMNFSFCYSAVGFFLATVLLYLSLENERTEQNLSLLEELSKVKYPLFFLVGVFFNYYLYSGLLCRAAASPI